MLVELNGKGGKVCQPACDGVLRCPLIVRPNSEDAITGNLFGVLQAINPRHWLPHLLNEALEVKRFNTQVYRNLKIQLWQKQPIMPGHLVPWKEGRTEVDVVITWENPATTVFIEMKYKAVLSENTSHHFGHSGYPSDQLIRNARVGLYKCGWYEEPRLFEMSKRDFVLLLISPKSELELVKNYRNPKHLRRAIPRSDLLKTLPRLPFVGQLSYRKLLEVLCARREFLQWSEKVLVNQLCEYLESKLSSA